VRICFEKIVNGFLFFHYKDLFFSVSFMCELLHGCFCVLVFVLFKLTIDMFKSNKLWILGIFCV
jgi:hypothetical protein